MTLLLELRKKIHRMMKRLIMIRGTTVTMLTMFACAYLSGAIQGDTMTSKQVVIEVNQSIANMHIWNECLPIDKWTCYYQGDRYTCFSFRLEDTDGQLDDLGNGQVIDVMEHLPEQTEDFNLDLVDMGKVVGFTATKDGLQLYFDDGAGYWWEW